MSQATTDAGNNNSVAAAAAVIDLTDAPAAASCLEEYTAAYQKEASRSFNPPKHKRQKSSRGDRTGAALPKDVEAIDVDAALSAATTDGTNCSTTNKPDYRQVLGPLRMGFVDEFVSAHNVKSTAYH